MKTLLPVILVFALCQQSWASLVIGIFNNDTLFVAADSQASELSSDKKMIHRKIFKASDTCCVAITGQLGSTYKKDSQVVGRVMLSEDLELISREVCLTTNLPREKISRVVSKFDSRYREFCAWQRKTGFEVQLTHLCFWGYDRMATNFFCGSYVYSNTNVVYSVPFQRGAKAAGKPIMFVGENEFLPALISAKSGPLKELKSHEFERLTSEILNEESPVPEREIEHYILELFDLHSKYAAKFSANKGRIGEPYVIFKITKETAVELPLQKR
jgi:hypothetical protein